VLLIAFFGPRVTLVYFWLTDYLEGVFQTALWPILGFLFMPFTTLVYAIAMHNGGLTNFWVIVLAIAVALDLGVHGGSETVRRGRRSTD
jgi:hypothetical protein